MKKTLFALAFLLSFSATAGAQTIFNAAGATFPAPIYQKWFEMYHDAHSNVQVNYQALGSGAGVTQLTAGTVDFGASDFPLTDDQISKMNTKALHFPTVVGAVVPTYNIPGVTADLRFTSKALAGIFLGTITKWNDPEIGKANPNVKLPGDDIIVVHRSDSSGSSFIFTDFLSKVSPAWKSKVGVGAAPSWPVGLGGKGSDGLTGLIKQTPDSIGYVELYYALQNKVSFGAVQNAAGKFLKADLAGVTAAAAAAAKVMPADFRVSITNAPGATSYPICSFTWLLIPAQFSDTAKRDAVKNFLNWMLTDGQNVNESMSYGKLPALVVAKEKAQVAMIK